MSKIPNVIFLWFIALHFCWNLGIVLSEVSLTHPDSEFNDGNLGSYFFYHHEPQYPRDCTEIRAQCSSNNASGVYLVKPEGYPEPFEVYCENAIDSGGWTVINRLQNKHVLSNRNWEEYKMGFGFLSQDFWIGNDKLSYLTNQKTYDLRIDFTSADGLTFSITYNKFRISDEQSEFRVISVGDYSGTKGDINRYLCSSTNEGAGTYISQDCSKKCSCLNGQYTCDVTYQCSPNAVCEERNNGPQCYCLDGYRGNGVTCTIEAPIDCQDVYESGSILSGVYKVKPRTWTGDPFDVFCNMTNGGGWTVFQRRIDGTVDFHRSWSDYKDGFGTPDHELWLGNDKLSNLTMQGDYELWIDFVNSLGDTYYATYDNISVSDESDKYRLSLGTYDGDAGNALRDNNGQTFTTRDSDNDLWSGGNCAAVHSYYYIYYNFLYCRTICYTNAGWWYNNCGGSYINSPYGTNCLNWSTLPGNRCNVKYTEMKIRPRRYS